VSISAAFGGIKSFSQRRPEREKFKPIKAELQEKIPRKRRKKWIQ